MIQNQNAFGGIDTSRLLATLTANGNLSYTATEDCIVVILYVLKIYETNSISIDNVELSASTYNENNGQINLRECFLLKEGQTINSVSNKDSNISMKVFGVKR